MHLVLVHWRRLLQTWSQSTIAWFFCFASSDDKSQHWIPWCLSRSFYVSLTMYYKRACYPPALFLHATGIPHQSIHANVPLVLVNAGSSWQQVERSSWVTSRESSSFGKCGHNSRWFSWLGYKPCMQNANTSPRWKAKLYGSCRSMGDAMVSHDGMS